MSDPTLVCPFCGSTDVEDVATWGGALITRQVRCVGCNTYFEALRADFDPQQATAASRPPGASR